MLFFKEEWELEKEVKMGSKVVKFLEIEFWYSLIYIIKEDQEQP